MILGITGNIGSGKSTFAKFLKDSFEKKGLKVNFLNADKIGHLVLEEDDVKKALIKRWGDSILDKDKLNRKAIRNIVFQDKEEYCFLCTLVWPKIKEKILKEKKENYINILEAAVLVESGWYILCDKIILIKSSFLKRFLRKPFLTLKEFIKINSFQYSEEILETYANYIVHNNSNFNFLKKQAEFISTLIQKNYFQYLKENLK